MSAPTPDMRKKACAVADAIAAKVLANDHIVHRLDEQHQDELHGDVQEISVNVIAAALTEAREQGRREGLKRAAEIAQIHAEQNEEQAAKCLARAVRMRRLGDPFGHGAMAEDGHAELTAAQHEAEAIEAAILSEAEGA